MANLPYLFNSSEGYVGSEIHYRTAAFQNYKLHIACIVCTETCVEYWKSSSPLQ